MCIAIMMTALNLEEILVCLGVRLLSLTAYCYIIMLDLDMFTNFLTHPLMYCLIFSWKL